MARIVVPVRYPLTAHSRRTLEEAIRVAEERESGLTILHVNLYQQGHDVTRAQLKRAVESKFGRIPRSRYVVRDGFLVEETILEEIAAEGAEIVVIGHKQAGRWQRMLRKLTKDPDVETYLRGKLDAEVITVGGS